MNRTIVAMSCNRSMQERTRYCVQNLCNAGAQFSLQTGSADVALARNMCLTMALRGLTTINRERLRLPDWQDVPLFDTVLMVDDDMEFTLEQAQELVTHARETGVPASAMYGTLNGTLAATRLFTPPPAPQLWVVGLGLLAIPSSKLAELAKASPSFDIHGETQAEFTWSGVVHGRWYSEDYMLTRRLGGVHLLPIPVGHLKTIPLYPAPETVACIREGKRLPGDLDSKILEHLTDPEMLEIMNARGGGSAAPDERCSLCGVTWKNHVQAAHAFTASADA